MEVQTNSTSVDNVNIAEINELIQKESGFIDLINMEVKKVIVGQQHMIESLLIGLLSNGHILLEGVPGLAKTLAISTLSKTIDAQFNRIQFIIYIVYCTSSIFLFIFYYFFMCI